MKLNKMNVQLDNLGFGNLLCFIHSLPEKDCSKSICVEDVELIEQAGSNQHAFGVTIGFSQVSHTEQVQLTRKILAMINHTED